MPFSIQETVEGLESWQDVTRNKTEAEEESTAFICFHHHIFCENRGVFFHFEIHLCGTSDATWLLGHMATLLRIKVWLGALRAMDGTYVPQVDAGQKWQNVFLHVSNWTQTRLYWKRSSCSNLWVCQTCEGFLSRKSLIPLTFRLFFDWNLIGIHCCSSHCSWGSRDLGTHWLWAFDPRRGELLCSASPEFPFQNEPRTCWKEADCSDCTAGVRNAADLARFRGASSFVVIRWQQNGFIISETFWNILMALKPSNQCKRELLISDISD